MVSYSGGGGRDRLPSRTTHSGCAGPPVGHVVLQLGDPDRGGFVILLAIADSIRRRRLTWGFLFLMNSMLVYWMESTGDWGQELVYSPTFMRHHALDWLPLKTPNDPLFMPFGYAVYWTVHALVVLWLGQLVARKFGWSMLKAILVLAIPVNYAWDFFAEGVAAAMGWWTRAAGTAGHPAPDGGRLPRHTRQETVATPSPARRGGDVPGALRRPLVSAR